MRLFFVWVSFLHHLRAISEYVLEETPVRLASQEVFAHGNECNKVQDCVGRKVVDLGTEEVQESSKKWVRGKRKTSLDMGSEENALTIARLGLRFIARHPPRPVSNQAIVGEIIQVLLHDRGADPVSLDQTRR